MNREAENGWRVGDLAVCVAKGDWYWLENGARRPHCGPAPEQLLRVAAVTPAPVLFAGETGLFRHIGLSFNEFPDDFYPAPLFRKVKPDAEAADDADLVALIKGVRVGADA